MPRPDGPSAPPPRLARKAGLAEPHPLATPQTARASIRIGERIVLEAEARATPIGLLAIRGMVAAILLSVPPILRAARAPRRLPSRLMDAFVQQVLANHPTALAK